MKPPPPTKKHSTATSANRSSRSPAEPGNDWPPLARRRATGREVCKRRVRPLRTEVVYLVAKVADHVLEGDDDLVPLRKLLAQTHHNPDGLEPRRRRCPRRHHCPAQMVSDSGRPRIGGKPVLSGRSRYENGLVISFGSSHVSALRPGAWAG
jgi:hypothetical protein